MVRSVRAATAALVATLVALVLSACGSDEPEASPPATSAPSSPSPTLTLPTAKPGETAREFIERWTELENYALNSGDMRAYRSIALHCRVCKRTASEVEKYYGAGGYFRTRGRDVTSVRRVPSDPGTFFFYVRNEIAPTEYKKSSSGRLLTFPGGVRTYKVQLAQKPDWQIINYTVLVS